MVFVFVIFEFFCCLFIFGEECVSYGKIWLIICSFILYPQSICQRTLCSFSFNLVD